MRLSLLYMLVIFSSLDCSFCVLRHCAYLLVIGLS